MIGAWGWALLALTVAAVAVQVVPLVALRRLRFAPVAVSTHLPLDAAPESEATLCELAAPRLRALGFTPSFLTSTPAPLVSREPCPVYSVQWRHDASGAWAAVTPAATPEAGNLYSVTFATFYRDGRHLLTTARRGHEMLIVHPAFAWCDTLGTLEAQWQLHQERMTQRDTARIIDEHAALEALEAQLVPETRAHALRSGALLEQADGVAQFTWRGAWRCLRQYRSHLAAVTRNPLPPEQANGVPADDPRGAELRALADTVALRQALLADRHTAGAGFQGLLLLGTALLSLFLFGWQFDLRFAVLLLAVLALHELGHLAAMRWAGYRDLRMVFIPLFGAVASGRHADATPWQRLVVLLAGPVPGMLLGGLLAALLLAGKLTATPWLLEAVALLVLLNYFNLLPFVPLDGGRVLELLLLEARPRLRGLFAAVGALGIAAVGLWSDSSVALVLAALLAIGLPGQLRQARLLARLRTALPHGVDDDLAWLGPFARTLAAPDAPSMPYAQRVALAQQFAQGGAGPAPTRAIVAVGLALYLGALLLPLVAFSTHGVSLLPGLMHQDARSAPPRDPSPAATEARLASASSPRERVDVLLAAAHVAEDGEDLALAEAHYQRALEETSSLTDQREASEIEARLGLASVLEDRAAARAHLERVVELTSGEAREWDLARADALFALAIEFHTGAQAPEMLREALALRLRALPAADWRVDAARATLAARDYEAGAVDDAIELLRARLAALPTCTGDCADPSDWQRTQARADLVWALLGAGRIEAAREALSGRDEGDRAEVMLSAWTAHLGGDSARARALMERLDDASDAPRMPLPEALLRIDHALFAAAAGDVAPSRALAAELTSDAARAPSKRRWISLEHLPGFAARPYVWQATRHRAELAWLREYAPAVLSPEP